MEYWLFWMIVNNPKGLIILILILLVFVILGNWRRD